MCSSKQPKKLVLQGNIEKTSILFNGFVRSPIPILLFPLLVGLGFFLLSILSIKELAVLSIPAVLCEDTANITSIYQDGPLLVLATDDQEFRVLASALKDNEQILSKDSTLVLLVKYSFNAEEEHFDLWNIQDITGENIVSTEQIYLANKQRAINVAVGLCAITVVYFAAILFAYIILTNAPKYPRLSACLIRKEFRKSADGLREP